MIEGSNNIDDVDWGQPIDWGNRLNCGLVSLWLAVPNRLGFGTTKWRDMVQKHQKHGTLNGLTPSTAWTHVGGRPCLGGFSTANYVNAPVKPETLNDFTMAAWFRATSLSDYAVQAMTRSGVSGIGMFFSDQLGNPMTSTWENHSDEYQRVTGLTSQTGEWTFFASSASTSRGSILRAQWNPGNGFLTDSQSKTLTAKTLITGTGWYLGRDTTAVNAFSGQIRMVAVWHHRAMSLNEMYSLFVATRPFVPEPLNRIALPRYAAAAAAGGLSIPIAAYHYNHHLTSMAN